MLSAEQSPESALSGTPPTPKCAWVSTSGTSATGGGFGVTLPGLFGGLMVFGFEAGAGGF